MTNLSDRAPRGLWGLLLLYFGAQLVARLWVSDALELDEAEQVLWTQQLALGYGTQPPLYTWLQWLVFQLTGVSLLGLALLKNGLLASIYAFTYRAGRKVLAWPWAATAAAAMLLLPELGWEAQRDLTHSVLSTSAAAALLWLVFELLDRPRPGLYLGLGVALAAGTLGKYSFVLYAAALAAAVALSPRTRALLFNRWMLAAVALALTLLMPHALWAAIHAADVSAGTLAKMQSAVVGVEGVGTAARGTLALLRSVLGFVGPLALVLLVLLLWRPRHSAVEPAPSVPRELAADLLTRYGLVLASALLVLVLTGTAASFKARWLLPLLFMLPLALVLAQPAFMTTPRRRALQLVIAIAALLVLVMLGLRPLLQASRGRPDELNVPARALARALHDAGWRGGRVLADKATTAAVLRLHGAAQTAARHYDGASADQPDKGTPTLWIAAGKSGASWRAWRGEGAAPCGPERVIELPYRHARPGAPALRWTYCIAPPP